ncbi:unnamed protein product, partial [Enterobius vermicularis]|uniref:AAA_lid_11 domain-containing protein n=1 Tax=Enterobius vermicularis TaxID=51028 RepID=A0A0N4VLF9_ENTVE
AWTEFYEFNDSDLRAARQAIEEVTANLQQENQIPWEFIHGLMQMVFYGNRINKIHDNNVLMAYVKENFNLKVINGKVMELKNKIKIPVSSRLQDYINATENQFQHEDSPLLFGLPENVAISWEIKQSKSLLQKLRHAQLETNEGTEIDQNRWHTTVTSILGLWKRLNAQNTLHITAAIQPENTDDPIEQALILEYTHAVHIVSLK